MLFDDALFVISIFEILAVIFLGLALGSFTTMVVHRVPRSILRDTDHVQIKSLWSMCPHCGGRLNALNLIPLFSWLFQKGRCTHCDAKISALYPVIELSVLCLVLIGYALFGLSLMFGIYAVMCVLILSLFVIDLKHMLLPNILVGALFVLGLFYHALNIDFSDIRSVYGALQKPLFSAVVFAFVIWSVAWIMQKLMKKDVLGFGDVKFFGVAGLWLGLGAFPLYCLMSGVIGIVMGVIWKALMKQEVFPFGPALILSFYMIFLKQNTMGSSFFF